ncbi:MAG TPA: hypothetical protein VKV80_14495 [Streptosporangiaceae bacterium]|nr:hypothetical protein [Streptosporangiaceae bacterium]
MRGARGQRSTIAGGDGSGPGTKVPDALPPDALGEASGCSALHPDALGEAPDAPRCTRMPSAKP